MSSTATRDDGLRRISTITRWVAALGVTGTALIAGIVYRATPGRVSSSPAPAAAPTATADPNAPAITPVDPNAGFQAPAAVPVPVQQAPVVRSGGS